MDKKDKSNKPETRNASKTMATKLTEAELEIVRDQLSEQTQRIALERQAVKDEQSRFEKKRERSLQEIRELQEKLAAREGETRR
jgi:hypothetical protein